MTKTMTSTRVCELFGIAPKTLYLWERDKKVPAPARDRRGWRVYSPAQVAAVRRFAGAPAAPEPRARGESRQLQGLSARNQLRGTVASIVSDGLLSEVVLRLGDGQEVVSVVTRSSLRRLGIRKGGSATAVVKSTEVMLFK
jgi:molybdopterin-binding protein